MLLKLYIASVITCTIPLIFYMARLRKLIYEFENMNIFSLIIAGSVLFTPGLIPIVNVFIGMTWMMNAFFISDYEFIEIHLED